MAFKALGVIVIDEQHRFGVEQRAALRGKGDDPDVLVMTATPIPRTAAMTVYGDLDVTMLDELPPGRTPVTTHWARGPLEEAEAHQRVADEVAAGRQAYVVCPLVEESEKIQARSAIEERERLAAEVWPDLRLGLLHGQMPSKEKEAVMTAFRQRELDVLVATTVIEVGVDVPNATVMIVEDADRFGIAQLHQLRGRVGRGRTSRGATCSATGRRPSRRPGSRRWRRPPTGSCWPRSTSTCGARARCSAPARRATPTSSWPPCAATGRWWPRPAGSPSRSSTPTPA